MSHSLRCPSDCTEDLSTFLTDSVDQDWWVRRETAGFLLYLVKSKPAFEFTILSSNSVDDTAPLLSDEVPSTDIYNGFPALVSKIDIPHKRRTEVLSGGYTAVYYECVSDTDAQLPPTLPDADSDTYHRDWGEHYGYPESAINSYVSDDGLRIYTSPEDYEKFIELLKQTDITWDDARRIALVSFVPPATVKGITEAIELGNEYEAILHSVADEYDWTAVTELVDSILADFDESIAGAGSSSVGT